LNQMGYRADVASNGRETIEALRHRPYDIIFMDVQMSEMDGLEATRRIRQEWRQNGPRIIAMTANAMPDDRDKCLAAGMDDYIAKPVNFLQIQAILQRHGTERNIERNPTLDATILAELSNMGIEGGPDIAAELIQLYLGDLPDRIEGIRTAIGSADPGALQREAHRLKGSSQQVGAARLAALCAELERLGKQQRTSDAVPFFTAAEREAGQLRLVLSEEKERRTPDAKL